MSKSNFVGEWNQLKKIVGFIVLWSLQHKTIFFFSYSSKSHIPTANACATICTRDRDAERKNHNNININLSAADE